MPLSSIGPLGRPRSLVAGSGLGRVLVRRFRRGSPSVEWSRARRCRRLLVPIRLTGGRGGLAGCVGGGSSVGPAVVRLVRLAALGRVRLFWRGRYGLVLSAFVVGWRSVGGLLVRLAASVTSVWSGGSGVAWSKAWFRRRLGSVGPFGRWRTVRLLWRRPLGLSIGGRQGFVGWRRLLGRLAVVVASVCFSGSGVA
jgi:hypothetical protein